jgi:hypothetical protein
MWLHIGTGMFNSDVKVKVSSHFIKHIIPELADAVVGTLRKNKRFFGYNFTVLSTIGDRNEQ